MCDQCGDHEIAEQGKFGSDAIVGVPAIENPDAMRPVQVIVGGWNDPREAILALMLMARKIGRDIEQVQDRIANGDIESGFITSQGAIDVPDEEQATLLAEQLGGATIGDQAEEFLRSL